MNVDIEQFKQTLDSAEIIYLSTSKDDIVTSRPISPVREDLTVYIRTAADSRKAVQMEANSNVAICIENFYMEGTAHILGFCKDIHHPQIARIKELYIKRYPDAFSDDDEYLSEKDVFIAIGITKLHQWIYQDQIPVALAVKDILHQGN